MTSAERPISKEIRQEQEKTADVPLFARHDGGDGDSHNDNQRETIDIPGNKLHLKIM